MRLTEYTDYCLRVLLYVAVHPDELVTGQRIAETFGIPKNHLTKIVAHLSQLGFLKTVRGRSGGITLGMAPQQINLGAVVRATAPDFRLVAGRFSVRCPTPARSRLRSDQQSGDRL